jgi:hypothetical protein
MVTVTPCVAVFGVNDVMVAVVLTIGLDFSFLQENSIIPIAPKRQ